MNIEIYINILGASVQGVRSPSEQFSAIDTDGNEKISVDDGEAWHQKYDAPQAHQKLRYLFDFTDNFKGMDKNGNGYIDLNEFDEDFKRQEIQAFKHVVNNLSFNRKSI